MTTKNTTEDEKNSFYKQMKELKLLSHTYFKIGIGLVIMSILGIIIAKVMGDYAVTIQIFKNILLVSLLVIAISKDKEEDEMTLKLRGQAFVLAFVWGVLYATVQPLISIIADFFITPEEKAWTPMSTNQVLFFMLLIQIAFYQVAKRNR